MPTTQATPTHQDNVAQANCRCVVFSRVWSSFQLRSLAVVFSATIPLILGCHKKQYWHRVPIKN